MSPCATPSAWESGSRNSLPAGSLNLNTPCPKVLLDQLTRHKREFQRITMLQNEVGYHTEERDRNQVGRRSFLAAATTAISTAVGTTAFGRDYGPDAEPVRYPEPDVIILDDRFKKYKLFNSPIRQFADCTGEPCGPKVPHGTGSRSTLSGATFPTSVSCDGWKKTAMSQNSGIPATTVTGIRSTGRADRFRSNI